MPAIDAHQHFWQYSESAYDWMGAGAEWGVIKRSFLPDNLAPLLLQSGLAGCVAVQARQIEEETAWLLSLADSHSIIKGVVGWVDLRDPALLATQLKRYASHPALVGVRHVIHDEPDGSAFMADEKFRAGIAALAGHDLTYDLLLKPPHLKAAADLVAAFPEQVFVLDHISKPEVAKGAAAAMEPWASDLAALAAYPNVSVKLSGMVTEAAWRSHAPQDFFPFLDVVYAAFGPKRERKLLPAMQARRNSYAPHPFARPAPYRPLGPPPV
jgi:L-fuconolactonase